MIYIHKILGVFISLSYGLIFLLILSFLTKKRWLTYFCIASFYIFSTGYISNKLYQCLEVPYTRKQPNEIEKADAIVVLGGMLGNTKTKMGYTFEWSDPDRFFGGIELMAVNKAKYLIFMGTKLPWNSAKENDGEILKKYAIKFGINKDLILVTSNVENTEGEANAVKKLLPNKGTKIILVTSAFHMKRARNIFEKLAFDVTEYPVDFHATKNSISILDFIPTTGNLAQSEFVLREILGIIIYKLMY